MNHSGITTGCATCHASGLSFANVVPVAPPATHVPIGAAACEAVSLADEVHQLRRHRDEPCAGGRRVACATCHATGKTFYGVTVVTPPATHIPVGAAACETCHSPTKFTNFGGTAMNHAPVSGVACATCHATGKTFYGVTVVTPPATHIPVGAAACESCHAPTQFTNFGGTAMNHAPVAGTLCATCHETGKTFYGVTMKTRPTPAQDPNHPTTGECGNCHSSTTSFAAGHHGQAGESHSDHAGVHAVPHHAGQLLAGGDEPQRDHDRLCHVPRQRTHLRQRGAGGAAGDAHSDGAAACETLPLRRPSSPTSAAPR